MKGYIHTGTVSDNGIVNTRELITNYSLLRVDPEDDGFHLIRPGTGDFEWWYFDIIDIESGVMCKIVAHLGTNPLRTKFFPQLAVSISTPESEDYFTKIYKLSDFTGNTKYCQIKVKNELEIRADYSTGTGYIVNVNLPVFDAELHFTNIIEGWKPFGNRVRYHLSGRQAYFMWAIPTPKASVSGYLFIDGNRYNLKHAIGYHDHNYWSVAKSRPLYIDIMVKNWCWGKCYCGDYTIIYMDTLFRKTRLSSLFVAYKDKIIHSSNNLVSLRIEKSESDPGLLIYYPVSFSISLDEKDIALRVLIESVKLVDRKDLLEGEPALLRWLIRNLVARPGYFSIQAKARLNINDKIIDGHGNYEYMVFRT